MLWPYILPLPVSSQIAMLFLLHSVNDLCKRLLVIHCKVGQDFAVEADVFGFHASDELGVGNTKLARSVVDTGNPEGAKIAFLITTITVSVA